VLRYYTKFSMMQQRALSASRLIRADTRITVCDCDMVVAQVSRSVSYASQKHLCYSCVHILNTDQKLMYLTLRAYENKRGRAVVPTRRCRFTPFLADNRFAYESR
jgi:hypothetical protein